MSPTLFRLYYDADVSWNFNNALEGFVNLNPDTISTCANVPLNLSESLTLTISTEVTIENASWSYIAYSNSSPEAQVIPPIVCASTAASSSLELI